MHHHSSQPNFCSKFSLFGVLSSKFIIFLIFHYYTTILILNHQNLSVFLVEMYIYNYFLLCLFITVSEIICPEFFKTFIILLSTVAATMT